MIRDIKYGTYIFFAAFCFLAALWVWFFCPETKNKTLEEVGYPAGGVGMKIADEGRWMWCLRITLVLRIRRE